MIAPLTNYKKALKIDKIELWLLNFVSCDNKRDKKG